jgi:hypothetical protein
MVQIFAGRFEMSNSPFTKGGKGGLSIDFEI